MQIPVFTKKDEDLFKTCFCTLVQESTEVTKIYKKKTTTKKQIITFDTQVVNACEILSISLLMNGTL